MNNTEENSLAPAARSSGRLALLLVAAIFFILIAGYALVAARFWANKPRLSRNYAAELNAETEKIPENERAWPKVRAALIKLRSGLVSWGDSSEPPNQKQWESIAAYLNESKAALDELRQAAALPRLGYIYIDSEHVEDLPLTEDDPVAAAKELTPASENPQCIYILLPAQQCMAKATSLVSYDLRRAAEAGDGATAVADLEAVKNLARLMQDPPFAVTELISYRALADCCLALAGALQNHVQSFDDEQLAEIAKLLADISAHRLSPDLRVESLLFGDIEQRVFTDDGQGDGYQYPQGTDDEPLDWATKALLPLKQSTWRQKFVSRREHREKVEALFAQAERELKLPYWQRDQIKYVSEIQRIGNDRRWLWIATLFPNLELYEHANRVGLLVDATQVAVALERFHRRSGNWPQSVDELVPDFLQVIPTDRFDGQPLRYRLVDGRPLVYSVYVDKTDDQGQVAARIIADGIEAKTEIGDLILWPVPTDALFNPPEPEEEPAPEEEPVPEEVPAE